MKQSEWFKTKAPDGTSEKEKIEKEVLGSPYIAYLEKDAKTHAKNFNLSWLKAVEVLEAEKTSDTTGRVLYRFPVQHEYLNPTMTLQGGVSAAMYDAATTWLLSMIRKPGFWMNFGTSRTLNVTFLRPAAEGEMLLMETELVHAGRKLCLMKASLMRESDRALISTCEHQKFNVDADAPKI